MLNLIVVSSGHRNRSGLVDSLRLDLAIAFELRLITTRITAGVAEE